MSVSTTANLGLTLPYQTDPVAVSEQNSNMGLIDGFAGDEWANMGIVETGDTATHAIAAGQYVIWKGLLYTADSAISVGTTLSRGGSGSSGTKNLTAVSNGGFNALNSNLSAKVSKLGNAVTNATSISLDVTSWGSSPTPKMFHCTGIQWNSRNCIDIIGSYCWNKSSTQSGVTGAMITAQKSNGSIPSVTSVDVSIEGVLTVTFDNTITYLSLIALQA